MKSNNFSEGKAQQGHCGHTPGQPFLTPLPFLVGEQLAGHESGTETTGSKMGGRRQINSSYCTVGLRSCKCKQKSSDHTRPE